MKNSTDSKNSKNSAWHQYICTIGKHVVLSATKDSMNEKNMKAIFTHCNRCDSPLVLIKENNDVWQMKSFEIDYTKLPQFQKFLKEKHFESTNTSVDFPIHKDKWSSEYETLVFNPLVNLAY